MMTAVVVGVALGLLEWRVVKGNRGAEWNGYGALLGVIKRDRPAPMRYRVLMGWVLAAAARVGRFTIRPVHYQAVKTALMVGALAVAQELVGTAGMLAVALGCAVVMEFDYWDCYAELLGVGLVLLGSREFGIGELGNWGLGLVVLGGVVWGLSKETVLLAPVLAMVAAGGAATAPVLAAGMAGPLALGLVRAVQGRAELYCERWTWRVYNWPDLRAAWERRDVGMGLSLVWMALWGYGNWGFGIRDWGGVMGRTAWVAVAWLVAGWTLARARETRVFLPTVLWMAWGLVWV